MPKQSGTTIIEASISRTFPDGSSRPLLAKLSYPRIANAVPRRRLFELLDAGTELITWLQGPPGSGKTSLIASYLVERNLVADWFQIDPSDDDLASFFYYLRLTAPRDFQSHIPALTPEYLQDPLGFFRRFFRELYGCLSAPRTIVFDDYQEVPETSRLHQALSVAADEAPRGIKLMVLSHFEPPPAFIRHRANRQLVAIGWESLSLDLSESAAIIAQRRPDFDSTVIENLHRRAHGWVAGLILLLEQDCKAHLVSDAEADWAPTLVFEYFAQEVFQQLDADSQGLLCGTSMLASVNAELASKLTGLADAGDRLEELYRRQLFINRGSGDQPWYQLHNLYRLFVLQEAKRRNTEGEWRERLQSAAQALVGYDLINEAVALLVEAAAWDRLLPLVLNAAQNLIRQGRWQTLARWIETMPVDLRRSHPWILYWQGVCRMMVDPSAARDELESAFHGFRRVDDRLGQALAATAVIESQMLKLTDYVGLDEWIAQLESLLNQEKTRFPSPNISLAVRSALFAAIVHRQTFRSDIPALAAQLIELVRHSQDPNYTLLAARGLLVYAAYSGDAILIDHVESIARSAYETPEASPFNRVWYAARLGFALRYIRNAPETVRYWFGQAREIARDNGLGFLEAPVAIFSGWAEEVIGETADIRRELSVSEQHFNPSSQIETAYRQMTLAFVLARDHEIQTAVGHLYQTLAFMENSGFTLGQLAARMGLVGMLMRSGNSDKAEEMLQGALSAWFPCPMRAYAGALIFCRLALIKNHAESAKQHLQDWVNLGEQFNLETYLSEHFLRETTAAVCAFALEHGIGSAYAERVIRAQGLKSPIPELEPWPRAIRIYLLGRFAVVVDGQALSFTGKAPKKPLELLKALIAAGGIGVDAHRLCEQLWPDAEAPRDVFRVTYARLRKLFPYDDVVILDDGKLSLNSDLVWTDIGAFESLTERATRRLGAAGFPAEALDGLGLKLAELYQGELLKGETDAPWLISSRDRVRSKFFRLLKELGTYWEHKEEYAKAQSLYTRALEIDGVAEDIYRRLMICHSRSAQPAEALRVYRRCQQMLSQVLGVTPTAETTALAERIRGQSGT